MTDKSPGQLAVATSPQKTETNRSFDACLRAELLAMEPAVAAHALQLSALVRSSLQRVADGEVGPPSPMCAWANAGGLASPSAPDGREGPLSPASRRFKRSLWTKLKAETNAKIEVARRARCSEMSGQQSRHEGELARLREAHAEEVARLKEAAVAELEASKEQFVRELSGKSTEEILGKLRRQMLAVRHTKVVDKKDAEIGALREALALKEAALLAAGAQLAEANGRRVQAVVEKAQAAQQLQAARGRAAEARAQAEQAESDQAALREVIAGLEARLAEQRAQAAAAAAERDDERGALEARLGKVGAVLLCTRLPNAFVSALCALDVERLRREAAAAMARGGLRLGAPDSPTLASRSALECASAVDGGSEGGSQCGGSPPYRGRARGPRRAAPPSGAAPAGGGGIGERAGEEGAPGPALAEGGEGCEPPMIPPLALPALAPAAVTLPEAEAEPAAQAEAEAAAEAPAQPVALAALPAASGAQPQPQPRAAECAGAAAEEEGGGAGAEWRSSAGHAPPAEERARAASVSTLASAAPTRSPTPRANPPSFKEGKEKEGGAAGTAAETSGAVSAGRAEPASACIAGAGVPLVSSGAWAALPGAGGAAGGPARERGERTVTPAAAARLPPRPSCGPREAALPPIGAQVAGMAAAALAPQASAPFASFAAASAHASSGTPRGTPRGLAPLCPPTRAPAGRADGSASGCAPADGGPAAVGTPSFCRSVSAGVLASGDASGMRPRRNSCAGAWPAGSAAAAPAPLGVWASQGDAASATCGPKQSAGTPRSGRGSVSKAVLRGRVKLGDQRTPSNRTSAAAARSEPL